MSTADTRSGVVAAVPGGIAAYVVGYVLTFLATSNALDDSTLNQITEAFADGGSVVELVGWVFYNAHFVSTTIDIDVPVVGGSSTVNLIAESGALSPILYAIPPALLFAAGIAAVRAAGASDADVALRVGPAVTLGYLPLAVVGAFLFTVTVGGSSGQPTLLPAAAVAGVVYPIVFGTLGAIVATAVGGRGQE